MPKGHESKLFTVDVHYSSGNTKVFVFRTRAAARTFAAKKKGVAIVARVYVYSATWGPDA